VYLVININVLNNTLKYSCNVLLPGHLMIPLLLWYQWDFLSSIVLLTLAKDIGI